jgi:hypothetical protein
MSNYFCIDTLLLEETPINITLTTPSVGVEFLDFPHNLSQNTRLTTPLWLAELFHRKALASISTPEIFGPHIRDLLERGAINFEAARNHKEYFLLALRLSRGVLGDKGLFRAALFAVTLRLQAVVEGWLFAAAGPGEELEGRLVGRVWSRGEVKVFARVKAAVEEAARWRRNKVSVMRAGNSFLLH